MAVRLSVIMVHSVPPTVVAGRTVEAVVGELIGLNGIDLTLVGPITEIGESSTDALTLESLAGDVAVLDWQSPPEIMAALSRVGFGGERSPHEHDLEASTPPANVRRIYLFDLREFSRPEGIIQALSRLNANRQVRTFSLGLAPPQAGKQKPSDADGPPSQSEQRSLKEQKSVPRVGIGVSAGHGLAANAAVPPRPGESIDLDDLLDQLDLLDP